MIKAKHIVLGILGLAGGTYLWKLNRVSGELETSLQIQIHKVSISGITVRIDVTLKNPTNGSIRIRYPFVKLLSGDTTIASSTVKNDDVIIPKFGQVKLDPIFADLTFFALATSAPRLLKEYRSTGKLKLTIKALTTINGRIPYTKTQDFEIGNSS